MIRYELRLACSALCAVALLSAVVRAAEPSENAALVHWQAFAQLPASDDESDELLAKAATVTLDERTKQLITSSTAALAAMQRAATMPVCDWGLDYSAGPHMVMPHLAKARQMARYACLHARHQIAAGQTNQALQTIHDTFVLARHAGADKVLISILVQDAIERLVIETISRDLPRLDRQQLDDLLAKIDSLPPGSTVVDALKTEDKVFVGWARRVVKNANTDEEAIRQLRSMVEPPSDEPPLNVTRDEISKWLDGTAQDYRELREIFELPDEEFDPRWDALIQRAHQKNPFSALVLPGLKAIRASCNRDAVTWALFRAAIVVQRDGEKSLASIKDPFGDGPFTYKKLPNGFQLTSKFQFRGEPVELTIGR